ncbi:MAG: hypothetical protein AAF572_02940 [Cyanobacteria bacterium P01_B01_bin.77]
MFNNIFQTTLTCSSIIVYISSLVLLFNTSLSTKQIEILLFGNRSNEQPLILFISIIVLLILPDLLAIISYGHARKNNPEIDQQPSAGFRILVDLILIGLIIWSLYNRLLTPVQGAQTHTFDSQISNIQLYMGGALALSFASLALFQPLKFLRNIRSEEETKEYLKSLTDEPPYINFHVHAYHYEWRTRWVTETHTDSRGNPETRTRPETYQEQVTTIRLSRPYMIPTWQDTTNLKTLLEPQEFPITKIKISTAIKPADANAQQHYNQAWSDFRDEYKNADTQVDFSTSKGIRGIGPVLLLSFLNPEERSIFLNAFFCAVISLTPFAWGYSLWLDQISSATEKIISKEYSLP